MTDEDLTYATAPHPYTPAVAAGDLVFVSGRVGVRDGKFVEGGVAESSCRADEVPRTNCPRRRFPTGNALKAVNFR
jgi:hypothetical protein